MKLIVSISSLFLFFFLCLGELAGQDFITFSGEKNAFSLSTSGKKITILVSKEDHKGVLTVAEMLKKDLEAVTGNEVEIINELTGSGSNLIIVGSVDRSPFIQQLKDDKKFKVDDLEGKWEKFVLEKVSNPITNVRNALVISGSDKRGTIFGMFELSKQIGVSPWYYWADAPIIENPEIYVKSGRHTKGEPDVKYRGIFINDEAPALTGWVGETFGEFGSEFYAKVFELILRSGGNYLWPAMWRPRSFSADDPENARLADELGVVISTSHHEPLMRAHDEWSRYGEGDWNYNTNKENLQEFWKGGIERMGDYESVVTVGMRGDGDEAMSEGTAVDLMKEIISDQRQIIADVTGRPASETKQVWAIYKEVQDYYDKGMRVQNDIMVLFCDDNWGNVRILPKKEDLNHEGGYGMYYHFDFVGGPVSYRWLNVTQIERVWEQMNLSYDWGVRDLWIVNVGDIKPMELPTSFFLDFAWDASSMNADDLPNYYVEWARLQFGNKYASEIADVLSLQTKYIARRTPEMLKPDTYSLDNYREADRVLEDYQALLQRSQNIYDQLPDTHKSAYYQLVHSPIAFCSNLNEMYVSARKNEIYARQGRASTNYYADKTKEHFLKDSEITEEYHSINNGKWNHFMDQKHIGYESWSEPRTEKMPPISYVRLEDRPSLGYAVEHGEVSRWTRSNIFSNSFSTFDPINDQSYYVEMFNSGGGELKYEISSEDEWINISAPSGSVEFEERVYISVDWDKVPEGTESGSISIASEGSSRGFPVTVPIRTNLPETSGFVENNRVVSIEATNFTDKTDSKSINWVKVPNMGRTASSMTIEPANAERQVPGKKTPSLQYEFTLFDDGDLKIETYLSPTLNYKKNEGLKYAIAIDDEAPQIINMHEGETKPDWEYPEWWNNSVTDHIKKISSTHSDVTSGTHTLKVWMVDPGVVFQKFVIDAGGLKPSYLGPPESTFVE